MIKKLPKVPGVLLLNMIPFTDDDRKLTKNQTSEADFSHLVRLGGGTIGADIESLNHWHKHYYSTMERYLEEGKFLGKVLGSLHEKCSDIFQLSNSVLSVAINFLDKSNIKGYLFPNKVGIFKIFF